MQLFLFFPYRDIYRKLMIATDKKILLSVAYLPPVSYFALLAQYPVWIEKNETFPKQTYRNRSHIFSDKGRMALSIPVTKPDGNHTRTDSVRIFNEDKWYLRHWRALSAAYEKSPYFLFYRDELEDFFSGKEENLFDFDMQLIHALCDIIGIKPDVTFTTDFEKNPSDTYDLRQVIHPKQPSILTDFPHYMQVFEDKQGFIPDLSILDLLFNLGPETRGYLTQLKFSL